MNKIIVIFFLYLVSVVIVKSLPQQYTGIDVYLPDEYSFNVSCLGCFIP